jgi:WD40 repeat protein
VPVSPRLLRSLPHPDRTATIRRVAFTPREHLFTAGYPGGVIQVWNAASGKELRRIDSSSTYRGSPDCAATPGDFSTLFVPIEGGKVSRDTNDSKTLYKVEYDGKVLVWDLATGKARQAIKPRSGFGVLAAQVSPDGKRLVVEVMKMSDPAAVALKVFDLALGKEIASFSSGRDSLVPAFSPDGRLLAASNHNDQVILWDIQKKVVVRKHRVEGMRAG